MIYPLLLCGVASFATGVGGIGAVILPASHKTLSVFQGFAAGVMVAVSFVEMLPRCSEEFLKGGLPFPLLFTALLFVAGWFCGRFISATADGVCRRCQHFSDAKRICLITTAVMVLHNLPEGMVTIFAGMTENSFALKMTAAVALHNIPEGIVVAGAVLYDGGSRMKAVGQSFFAGAGEFLGGVIAAIIFGAVATPLFVTAMLGLVSGIMVQTSVCELYPCAVKLAGRGQALAGTAVGFATMWAGIQII